MTSFLKPTLKSTVSNTFFFGILTGAIYEAFFKKFDRQILYWMQGHSSPVLKKISLNLSWFFSPTHWTIFAILCLVLFLALNVTLRSQNQAESHPRLIKLKANLLLLGSTLILAAVIATVIKFILARYRPDMLLERKLYGFHFFSFHRDYNSTPSGHTLMSFAGLFALSRIIQKSWATWLLLLLAVIIACSRIILSEHYTADILLGAYIGIMSIYWTSALMHLCTHKSDTSTNASVTHEKA
jgi:membrane-associated phospholipid phosphatase